MLTLQLSASTTSTCCVTSVILGRGWYMNTMKLKHADVLLISPCAGSALHTTGAHRQGPAHKGSTVETVGAKHREACPERAWLEVQHPHSSHHLDIWHGKHAWEGPLMTSVHKPCKSRSTNPQTPLHAFGLVAVLWNARHAHPPLSNRLSTGIATDLKSASKPSKCCSFGVC